MLRFSSLHCHSPLSLSRSSSCQLLPALFHYSTSSGGQAEEGFRHLKLHSNLTKVVESLGGTGKTDAYALPLWQRLQMFFAEEKRLNLTRRKAPIALILAPTLILSSQIANHLVKLSSFLTRQPNIYLAHQRSDKAILENVDVIVGTPERVKRLFDVDNAEKFASLHLKCIVLDEGDDLVTVDHQNHTIGLLRLLPRPTKKRCKISMSTPADEQTTAKAKSKLQVVLASATLPQAEALSLLKKFVPKYSLIRLENAKTPLPPSLKLVFYSVPPRKKQSLLVYLLKRKGSLRGKKVIVFVRTAQRGIRLCENLAGLGFKCCSFYKNAPKGDSILEAFKGSDMQILVTTDSLTRGFDFPELEFVLNYDFPSQPVDFVHRVGRTARGGREGSAISFISQSPQVISIGHQMVELNESHFFSSAAKYCNESFHITKIPGPWQDEQTTSEDSQVLLSRHEAEKLLEKKREIVQQTPEHSLRKMMSMNERRRLKSNIKENKKPESLRDFKEGRYEYVISQFKKRNSSKKLDYKK